MLRVFVGLTLETDVIVQVFTSEEVALPKQHVASFLESIDPKLCARFLEFLVNERAEVDADYHDRLAGFNSRRLGCVSRW